MLPHPCLGWPSLRFLTLFLVPFSLLLDGCKPISQKEKTGIQESFVENGEAWAYGSVELGYMDVPAQIYLRQHTRTDQNVDRRTVYELYGAIEARRSNGAKVDLAYVDLHPAKHQLLAYAYSLTYVQRHGRSNIVDVYGVLRKPGRSLPYQKKIYLGTASYQRGNQLAAVKLSRKVSLSKIARGVYQGRWALHYHTVVRSGSKFEGQCPTGVAQMPGQNPSQNPGQGSSCRLLPPKIDLCEGNPSQKDCRPQVPTQQGDTLSIGQVAGLEVDPDRERSYLTSESVGKVVFVSKKQDLADEDSATKSCADSFFAVARTLGGQINNACIVKPAPAETVDGKLACGVTVEFKGARTYLERVCHVHAQFQTSSGPEFQVIQVLKK